MDRRLIRIDCPSAQAGIAAALRRAFHAPSAADAHEASFEELLARLT